MSDTTATINPDTRSKKFFQTLNTLVQRIDKRLLEKTSQLMEDGKHTAPESSDLLDALSEFAGRRGKRIRGSLVIMGHRAHGPEPDSLYTAAAAIELFHAYLLIHDDIIDNDQIRRGGPTIHTRFAKEQNDKDSGAFLGILAGDLLSAWAMKLLLSFSNATFAHRAAKELSRIHSRVVLGQRLDMLPPEKLSQKSLSKMHDLKTGEYTFLLPLRIGAILSGADQSFLDAFTPYSMHLGRAFQAKDDLLDLFGQEAKTGKRIGTDIFAGRRTWLVDDLLSIAPQFASRLQEILHQKSLEKIQLQEVQELFQESGTYARCEAYILSEVQLAKQALLQAPFRKEAKEFLSELAIFVATRNS